jgi:hypothetical protein
LFSAEKQSIESQVKKLATTRQPKIKKIGQGSNIAAKHCDNNTDKTNEHRQS